MTNLTRLLKWILKAAIFFALFAFALNNQQDATVHLLFGRQWRAPMTLIVLVAFALGMVVGVLGMLPVGGSPDVLSKVALADLDRFTRVVGELGIKAE